MKICDNLVITINGKAIEGVVTLEYQMKAVDRMNNVEKKLGKIKSAYFGFEKNGGKRIGLFMELYCESGVLSSCSRFWDSIKIKPKFGYDCDSDGSYAGECIYYIENCELSKTPEGRLVKLAFNK